MQRQHSFDPIADYGRYDRHQPQFQHSRHGVIHHSDFAMKCATQQHELDPPGDARRERQSRNSPAPVDAEQWRQRQGAKVAENQRERHADDGELQRRARVAQRVEADE